MFGSNGPFSPSEYLPHFSNILEPIYYPTDNPMCPQQQDHLPLTFDSDPDCCHSSAPPTPDIISGLMSLTGGPSPPSDMSSGSLGDLTSPEPDYQSSTSSPPSYSLDISGVQATRSKLIKEGLKLTIQSRRMVQGLDNARADYKPPPLEELTVEDEDRRRRRRERNKVAATKCRNKKKERTGRLAEESESLEVNNNALKSEIQSLEAERNELIILLQGHLPNCSRNSNSRNCCYQSSPASDGYPTSWSSVSG